MSCRHYAVGLSSCRCCARNFPRDIFINKPITLSQFDSAGNGSVNTSRARGYDEIVLEVMESMEQGIIVWSDVAVCELVNARYYRLLNQGPEYLKVGMSRADYFRCMVESGDASAELIEQLEDKLAKRVPFNFERVISSGAVMAVYIRPIASGGHVVTYTDITEIKKNERMLSDTIKRVEIAEEKARNTLILEQERKSEDRALSNLSDWLQCCKSIDELYEIVRQAMARMFPGTSGQLFIYSNSRDVLDGAVTWGDENPIRSIQSQDCWALRRGRIFQYAGEIVRFPCKHVSSDMNQDIGQNYLCLPIVALGDTAGMLHIVLDDTLARDDNDGTVDHLLVTFAQRCAEQISMAIANVKLRDELHEQSTRDSLTGLYNRRYFVECFHNAISTVDREGGAVGLISFDTDNFKGYNDQFGHDAGDAVLCALGNLARQFFSHGEICCRTGGEEFSILLPGSDTDATRGRAENFLRIIASHNFSYRDMPLPTVTISAGVADYPAHGLNVQDVCRAADMAMYDAKESGKNVVRCADLDSGVS